MLQPQLAFAFSHLLRGNQHSDPFGPAQLPRVPLMVDHLIGGLWPFSLVLLEQVPMALMELELVRSIYLLQLWELLSTLPVKPYFGHLFLPV